MADSPAVQMRVRGRIIRPSRTSPPRRHPASVFRPGANFGFLDLPPEVRLLIYGWILEEERPISLKIIQHKKAPREVVREVNHRHGKHRGMVYDRESAAWHPAPPSHTSIMFLNHQVYAEATQALYANNIFRFASTTVLKDFLELLGTRVQHLRHIQIASDGYCKTTSRDALSGLRPATGLKKVEFAHRNFCSSVTSKKRAATVEKLAKDSQALMKSLQVSYQARGMGTSVLDVVSVSNPAGKCWNCSSEYSKDHDMVSSVDGWCKCKCAEAEKNTDALRVKLRSLIAKDLGLLEDGKDADLQDG